jgi:hypothetical protein
MSARVFIHPRYHEGPALGALEAGLQAAGLDYAKLGVGPADTRGRYELVRTLGPGKTGGLGLGLVLERMDGTQYTHIAGWPAPQGPEAA